MRSKKDGSFLKVLMYYVYLLTAWGLFRLLIRLPEVIEELWFKPVVWMLPLWWLWSREKRRVNLFKGSVKGALVWGMSLGLLYGLVAWLAGLSKYGEIKLDGEAMGWLDVVGIGLVTAVTEEVVFSGYLLQKIKGFVVSEWVAITLTGLGFVLIHLPIAIFVYGYGGGEMLGFLVVIMLMAMGNYWVMMRTRNVIAPILSHWWWGVAIYMFG
jgi:hypothetical protein